MNLDVLCWRAMRKSTNIAEVDSQGDSGRALAVEAVSLHLVRLPLKEAFETSFGAITTRLIFLVSLEAGGRTGWGEVVAAEAPRYSYETVGTAYHVIRDYLAPVLMAEPVTGLTDLARRFA
jgi:o-succinylbenzoate synthase